VLKLENTMNIARFEPWSYVDLLNRNVARPARAQADDEWRPAVDILENDARFLLRADVPGVDAGDIDVSMDAGVLTISGVRHTENPDESTDVRRIERAAGRFLRRFTLPEAVNADAITAKCSNGILEVVIPKQPEIQPRRITVDAA
jgi:HSP20 family protein